jgi:hypothetical protein
MAIFVGIFDVHGRIKDPAWWSQRPPLACWVIGNARKFLAHVDFCRGSTDYIGLGYERGFFYSVGETAARGTVMFFWGTFDHWLVYRL